MNTCTWADPLSFLSTPALLTLTALAVLTAAILTLAKVVFGIIHANYDENRDPQTHFRTINRMADTAPFYETIALGRLVSNSASAIFILSLLNRIAHEWTPWKGADILLRLIIIWGVLYTTVIFIPTLIGNLRPYSLSRFTLAAFRVVRVLFHGPATMARRIFDQTLRWAGYDPRLSFLTEDQREMLESDTTFTEDQILEDDGRRMILNIFDFVDTPVREIMTPRVDMLTLEADTPLPEVIRILNHERHSRIPVFRDTIDNIVGILHNRDFLHWYTDHHASAEKFNLVSLVRPAMFVPYHKKIDDLLRDLRRTGNQLAIVVDEYGGTAGLVTMEDILEEIVGDIRDEDDRDEEKPIQRLKEGKYLVDPLVSLRDLEDELGITLEVPEDSHVDTLSGLIHSTLGSLPAQGTELRLGPCRVKILKVDGTRMEKVLITLSRSVE